MKQWLVICALLMAGCGSSESSTGTPEYRTSVAASTHASIAKDIDVFVAGATKLMDQAPSDAWGPATAQSLSDMKKTWAETRAAYESIEGAVAPLFPDLDESLDQRYDAFLLEIIPSAQGDDNLFDGKGVTGMHAIERILWADKIPQSVIEFEKTLAIDGKNLYKEAAFPATAEEAKTFKNELCGKLVSDAKRLQTEWASAKNLDIDSAFQGLIDLMNEQAEKVDKAASSSEESRYSQRTMADLRGNLEGTKKVYALFSAWLATKPGGREVNTKIENGFASLGKAYAEVSGDGIPLPPATWKAELREKQSAADLATPFGKLYLAVKSEVDAENTASLATNMSSASKLLGLRVSQ